MPNWVDTPNPRPREPRRHRVPELRAPYAAFTWRDDDGLWHVNLAHPEDRPIFRRRFTYDGPDLVVAMGLVASQMIGWEERHLDTGGEP